MPYLEDIKPQYTGLAYASRLAQCGSFSVLDCGSGIRWCVFVNTAQKEEILISSSHKKKVPFLEFT